MRSRLRPAKQFDFVPLSTCSQRLHERMAFIPFVILSFLITETCGNPDAKRLYDDLMSSYNSLIRPVGNNSDRVTIKIGLKLSQLVDVVSLESDVTAHLYLLSPE